MPSAGGANQVEDPFCPLPVMGHLLFGDPGGWREHDSNSRSLCFGVSLLAITTGLTSTNLNSDAIFCMTSAAAATRRGTQGDGRPQLRQGDRWNLTPPRCGLVA